MALQVQKEAFENAYSAVSSTEDLTTALQAGKSVVLTGNVEVSADTIGKQNP